jgi:hypothetical protein
MPQIFPALLVQGAFIVRSLITMKCDYAIFCEKYAIDSSNQVTIEKMFSSLTLDGPGTAQFYYVLGISGIPNGEKVSIHVIVRTPENKELTGKWESPESSDESTVFNSFFSCDGIPFEVEGIYTFTVQMVGNPDRVISSRSLKVSFNK